MSQTYLLLRGASLEVGKAKGLGLGLGAFYLFVFLCLAATIAADIVPLIGALLT